MEAKPDSRKSEEKILDRMVSEGVINSCSIISKTGLHVACDSGSMQKKETFAAMSAIMLSAAETISTELKDSRLNHVAVRYERNTVLLIPLSQNYMLVGITDKEDERSALKVLRSGAETLLKEAPWLN